MYSYTSFPKIIKNDEVYKRTKATPWSVIIGQRRLAWLGHVVRLNVQTPARQALEYAMQNYKKKRGRPKLTWLKLVECQLKDIVTFAGQGFTRWGGSGGVHPPH